MYPFTFILSFLITTVYISATFTIQSNLPLFSMGSKIIYDWPHTLDSEINKSGICIYFVSNYHPIQCSFVERHLFKLMSEKLKAGDSDYTSTRHSMCKFIKDASVSH